MYPLALLLKFKYPVFVHLEFLLWACGCASHKNKRIPLGARIVDSSLFARSLQRPFQYYNTNCVWVSRTYGSWCPAKRNASLMCMWLLSRSHKPLGFLLTSHKYILLVLSDLNWATYIHTPMYYIRMYTFPFSIANPPHPHTSKVSEHVIVSEILPQLEGMCMLASLLSECATPSKSHWKHAPIIMCVLCVCPWTGGNAIMQSSVQLGWFHYPFRSR